VFATVFPGVVGKQGEGSVVVASQRDLTAKIGNATNALAIGCDDELVARRRRTVKQ
jgi:hypothetical protein